MERGPVSGVRAYLLGSMSMREAKATCYCRQGPFQGNGHDPEEGPSQREAPGPG